MRDRAVARAGSALESIFVRRGFSAADAIEGRVETRDWVATRLSALRDRREILTGRGIVVTGVGRTRLREFERLAAGPGELTVLLEHSAISPGTERAQWLRLPGARPELPYQPGYSGVGRVLPRNAAFSPAEATLPSAGRVVVLRTPHVSLATVPVGWTVPVPADVDSAAASLAYLAVIAGWGLERSGGVEGRSVTVIGAGTIGALAHRLAVRSAGTTTVIAATTRARATSLAAGADRFLTSRDHLSDSSSDVVIEATGTSTALQAAVEIATIGGTIVQLGSPRGPTVDIPIAGIQQKSLRVVGAHISSLAIAAHRGDDADEPFQRLASAYLDALATGLDVGDLVGESIDPREATLAYRRLADGDLHHAHFDWTRLPDDLRIRHRGLAASPNLPTRLTPVVDLPVVSTRPRVPATSPVRFGVIGCGDIGVSNARAIVASGNMVTICHDAEERLAAAAGDVVASPSTSDIEQVMDPERVDAVVLAVPHHLHEPLAQRALDAGLHVVVEKPLAIDLAAAQRIVRAAITADRAVTTCFPYRYAPDVMTARTLADKGAIGRCRGFCIVFHADKPAAYWRGGFSGRSTSNWRTRVDQAGGGVLIMNATHHIDLLRHLTGTEIETVHATLGDDAGEGIEDTIAIAATLSGGAVGTLTASSATPGAPGERFEIWGEHGTIRLAPHAEVFTERAIDGVPTGTWATFPTDTTDDSRAEFMRRFATAVTRGEQPDVLPEDGLAVQAFVEAAYESARLGAPTKVQRSVGGW